MRLFASDKPSFFVRHRVAVAAAVLVGVLVLALALALPVVVKGRLRARAAQARVSIQVESVRLGWGAIWLGGVTIKANDMPALTLTLDHMRVSLSALGKPRAVSASGGVLQGVGTSAEVLAQWQRWRGQSQHVQGKGSTAGPDLELNGLTVRWSGTVEEQATTTTVWGMFVRRSSAGEALGFDLARVEAPAVFLEAETLRTAWHRSGSGRALDSLRASSIKLIAEPDRLFALLSPPESAPVAAGSPSAVATPVVGFPRLNQAREHLVAWLKSSWSEQATVDFPHVQTELKMGEQKLNIGPARCAVERDHDTVRFSFVPGQGATRETLAFNLALPLNGGAAVVSLVGGPVGLDTLGVHEGDLGLREVRNIRISARSVVTLPDDRPEIEVQVEGQVENLSFFQPKLATEVVDAERIGWGVRATWNPNAATLEIPEGRLELGQIKALLSGSLRADPGNPGGKVAFEISLVSCQALFDSVPSSLLPELRGTRLQGTFALAANASLEGLRAKDAQFNWTVQNDCRISAVRPEITPDRFRQPFQYAIHDGAGLPLVRESGPMSREWTGFDRISPHLETAAIICEDSRFFSHSGIDEKAIESAVVANVAAGRFVRGASTISMQLAKNLYLGHEKTLSRKFQEAVLTVLLEQELSKREILELYFNVIEFGPDIWGIRAAADYYFGVAPSELSLGQALYLASILPNPRQHHARPDGTLSPKWAEYLKKLMHIAHKIKRINDEELAKGLAETVTPLFGKEPPPVVEPELEVTPEPTLGQALPESLPSDPSAAPKESFAPLDPAGE